MRVLARFRAAALVLAALLTLGVASGCGGTVIDDVKTEETLQKNLEDATGKDVAAVECPSGVEVVPGATFECTVRLRGGGTEVASLKIVNDDADVEVTDLKAQR